MCETLNLPFGSLITALYTAFRFLMRSRFLSVSSSSSSSNFGIRILIVRPPSEVYFFFLSSSLSLSYGSHHFEASTLDATTVRGPLSIDTMSFTVSLYWRINSPSSSTSTSCSSTHRYHSYSVEHIHRTHPGDFPSSSSATATSGSPRILLSDTSLIQTLIQFFHDWRDLLSKSCAVFANIAVVIH